MDAHADHDARFSPAAAVLVRPARMLALRASLGSGFKAPTFQQRYLDFTNAAAGYTVIGAIDVEEVLARYESEGIIERYENAGLLGSTLRPETSLSGNIGATLDPVSSLSLSIGAFVNQVTDLIDIVPVAVLTGGRQVYTYVNLDRVRTSGVELAGEWTPADRLSASLRYHFLEAVDLGALAEIDAGRVFRRENGVDVRVTRGDYGGLFGRSRHSVSGEVRWQTPLPGLGVSLRGVYRSRYGDFDRNGNLVLDEAGEYVAGYALVHSTLSYRVAPWITLQAGVENALDYTDPARIPALPGRSWFAALRVSRIVP